MNGLEVVELDIAGSSTFSLSSRLSILLTENKCQITWPTVELDIAGSSSLSSRLSILLTENKCQIIWPTVCLETPNNFILNI